MSEPLSLLPMALAGADGTLDGVPVRRLVSAGFALLQKTPPLVRALAGRRSAILLPPSPLYLVALAASEGRGALLLNPLAAPSEIAGQLADGEVGSVFTIAALADRLPAAMPRVLLDGAPEHATWQDGAATRAIALASHDALRIEGAHDVPGADEEATIVHTSAMDGYSLGSVATHRNLVANARATIQAAQLTKDDTALALLPFAHLFGLVVPVLAPLLAGGRVRSMERFHPQRAIDALEGEPITLLVGVPAVFAAMLAVLGRREEPLAARALRVCICGGAPLTASLQDEWFARTGVELRQGYGLTEAGPVCLFNPLHLPNRRGSLGLPFPGVDVSIRDPETGDPLPDGEAGEIWVRGDNVSPGYAGMRAGMRSGGLRRRGEWLATGDLGERDAEGWFTFRGVRKAMFTRNGFNIYPREIERIVAEMPGVRRATVGARPDPMREHEITLAVEGDVSADDVRRWCTLHLSAYKQPAEITVA